MTIPERPEIFKMILLINLENEQDCNYDSFYFSNIKGDYM